MLVGSSGTGSSREITVCRKARFILTGPAAATYRHRTELRSTFPAYSRGVAYFVPPGKAASTDHHQSSRRRRRSNVDDRLKHAS